jgi:hypothetical protein
MPTLIVLRQADREFSRFVGCSRHVIRGFDNPDLRSSLFTYHRIEVSIEQTDDACPSCPDGVARPVL